MVSELLKFNLRLWVQLGQTQTNFGLFNGLTLQDLMHGPSRSVWISAFEIIEIVWWIPLDHTPYTEDAFGNS